MRLSAMFNDDVAYDLGLTLEDTYILGYLYKISTITEDTKIINGQECFTFNLVELFKSRKRIFEQIPADIEEKMDNQDDKMREEIDRIYQLNRKRLDRIMKKNMSKVVKKVKNVKIGSGSKTYYRIERNIMKMLIDGYPKKVDTEFTELEKYVMKELNMFTLTKSICTQLSNMDKDVLKDSIEVAKECGIYDFPYVKGVYNNLIKNKKVVSGNDTNDSNHIIDIKKESNHSNSIPQNNYKSKIYNQQIENNFIPNLNHKIHNYPGSANFLKYTPEELERILEESQKSKFEDSHKDMYKNALNGGWKELSITSKENVLMYAMRNNLNIPNEWLE